MMIPGIHAPNLRGDENIMQNNTPKPADDTANMSDKSNSSETEFPLPDIQIARKTANEERILADKHDANAGAIRLFLASQSYLPDLLSSRKYIAAANAHNITNTERNPLKGAVR